MDFDSYVSFANKTWQYLLTIKLGMLYYNYQVNLAHQKEDTMVNKEQILSQSRKENKDEYEEKIMRESLGRTVLVLVVVCIFFAATKVIYSDIKGLEQGLPFYEFPAILFSYGAASYFYMFHKLKNKNYLISGACFTFAFLCFVVLYFLTLS